MTKVRTAKYILAAKDRINESNTMPKHKMGQPHMHYQQGVSVNHQSNICL